MQSRAQVWVDQGAVWHYDFVNVGYWGFIKYEYLNDTQILGKNCQVISGTYYAFTKNQYNNTVLLSQQNLVKNYTYVSGDTVFYYYDNKFHVLFNFGAVPGDRWEIALGADPYGVCNDTSYVVVNDTGKVTLNGTAYRYIKIQSTPDSPIGMSGTYVERFGNIDSSYTAFQTLFPGMYPCDTDYYAGTEWNRFKFGCFEDNSFSLLNSSDLECEYDLTHLDRPEIPISNFRCYPNPFSEFVNIEGDFGGATHVEIFNYQGQVIRSFVMDSTPGHFDLSSLEKGLYLLRLQNGTEEIHSQKIIKE
jgi:hypothetical protein